MKIILDLCGGTGSWGHPYKETGYNVINVTLPEHDVRTYIPPNDVYGILAAPPCIEFSRARNGHPNIPRDFITGLSVVDACLRIIWRCKPYFWALENPVGMLSRWLGKAPYIFDPWYFGDPWTKKTCLWGDFNLPRRIFFAQSEVMSTDQILRCRTNKRKLPSISGITSGKQKVQRAITPPGFANAFFKVNP